MKTYLHTWTWVAWLVSALIAISITRNLLYLSLILLCLLIVHFMLSVSVERSVYPVSLLRFGIMICGFSTIFNLLISHVGETVLFSLPESWPLLGGDYTLEAALFGLVNGLVLFAILVTFTVFNRALPVRLLIRLIPRAFFPAAVVISIAITFIPTTIRQFAQIKEAQLIRGLRMKGIRDWLPLVMALMVGGLEHALQLSEAMTARGFASRTARKTSRASAVLMVCGLLFVTIGWIMRSQVEWENWGLVFILFGVALIFSVLGWAGRQVRRTTYLREKWRLSDGLVLLGIGIMAIVLLLPFAGIARNSLYYAIYPVFQWPQFDPWIGTALLSLSLPAYMIGLGKR